MNNPKYEAEMLLKKYQKIWKKLGLAANISCSDVIVDLTRLVKLFDEFETINKEYSSKIIDYPNSKENESDDFFIYCSCGYPLKITGSIQCGRCGGIIQDKDYK